MREFLVMLAPVIMALQAWGELDKALKRDAPPAVIAVRLLFFVVSLALIGGAVWLLVQIAEMEGR